MTTKDLDNLLNWFYHTDGIKFAKDIYNDNDINEYKQGKFKDMQDKPIYWMSSLDGGNRQKLVDAINKKGE